ncbi:Ig-like domain-containing protein [Brachybacterium sp. Marseille-Q7125]|uniref:Ig-like domain-containing protein n=1 Tax=Brachybacterium sp. Marseille-Q7125 TaxID=2932815 RepID=UPI001FF57099|nr:Ig-like domain-containing protein [Brachybacterium sp. Marseille-Q7125]
MAIDARAKRRRSRRVTAVSVAVLSVIAVVLTGFALRYDGLSSSEVEVSNGGVWVTNGSGALMGRVNVDAAELDARLSHSGQDLDILQSGYTVIETGPRGFTPINTAAVTRGGLVELAPGSQIKLGGDRVAISSPDGRVWILSPDEAAAFNPSAVEPVLEGVDGAEVPIAVSTSGTVFVLDGSELKRFPRAQNTRDTKSDKTFTVGNVSTKGELVDLTTVGEQPVVLDRENHMLRLGEDLKDYQLNDYGVASLENAEIQQPGPASQDVVLATADALFRIPLSGGEAQQIPARGTGTTIAPPAQVGGCAYGAWGGSLRYVRACEGHEPVSESIPEASSDADLVLRVNRDLVILNDQKFGLSWEIADSMELVDDWLIEQEIQTSQDEEKEKETLTTTITNVAAERDEENRPPAANDDTFGVRPGQSVVLPVVRNDHDPDGDILSVEVEGEQPSIGTVTPIQGGTQLQIDVDEDASGEASFEYVADDGRGGTDTARVTLEVRADGENSGPQPAEVMMPKVQVRAGESVSFNILPYWEDPDGDAFYLSNATIQPQDIVTFRTDGTVMINDAGLSPGTKQIQLTFRDEHGATGEGVLEVESVTDSDLAPITTADHASIVAGRTTTIKPLVNDLNPNGGSLELLSVSESEDLEVEAVLEAGTLNITAASPGTHYLEYTVAAAGSSQASLGLIRVDVVEPDSANLAPVAVDDMDTVTTGGDTLVDPLQNDVDPTGGVLVVNRVTVPEGSGLKATIINHHLVRIDAEPGATVGEEPVPVTYEIANSIGSATGTIRVMVASTDTQFATPEAVPDRAVVRAGDMVNIDVLANDTSPTGAKLHLGQISDTSRSEELGHAEPNQDMVRFTADDDAQGEAVLTYQVVDETGRDGSAQVHITIIPRDAENAPPKPDNLTARTVAGTEVRIPVDTTGIDPDGDSVMLTGITSPMPALGEVVSATGEWIVYRPYADSVGTDRFRYQVMDRHGAIGTAEVLVGIAEPHGMNQPPFAVDDVIEVKPDREVQIPVLDNDTDPDGDPLSIVRSMTEPLTEIEYLEPAEGSEDGYVTVVSPSEPGTHTLIYGVSDGQLTSTASITVKVAENATDRNPIARDDFVPVDDVLDPDMDHVMVDVLANDSDPDGSTNDLTVTLEGAPEGVTEGEGHGTFRIVPQEEQQRLRYVIEDPDGLTSAGYIWVPGTAKQAPVWVGDPLQVQSGSEATVDLASSDNVRVRPGAQAARIENLDTVTAEHHDGGELVKDESTLVYRPAEGFTGEDTITVEVTDGVPGDATAAVATLAIPVVVSSEDENLPPTFQGSMLEVEQGGAASTLDLAIGASDPEDDDLTFALGEYSQDPDVTVSLEGSTLRATADASAHKGTVLSVPVTVSDGTNDPVEATVQITVGGSQRPTISTGLDEATIDAGDTKTLSVLENDSNPFPGGERTITGASLVSGKGQIDYDADSVTITPAPDFHGYLTAQYQVIDETGDPDRKVSGEIRVTVRGLPEEPSAPRIGEVGDGFVELNFKPGADNGAPIRGYTVTSASGPAVSQECSSTSCRITGLSNDTEYTFQVVATNEVGDSKPSAPSAVARPDVRPEAPDAPRAERGDKQLTVSWSAPVNRGSAIQKYELQLQNTATNEVVTREVDGSTTSLTWTELTNGVDYRFRVRAANLADEPSDWSGWSQAEHPAGKPAAPGEAPSAKRVENPVGGGITVTWSSMTDKEANGEPITEYIVTSSSGAKKTVKASRTTATFQDLDRDAEHTFTVRGVNSVGTGPASGASNAVTPWAKPSPPTGVTADMPDKGKGAGPNGRATVSWKAADGNGTKVTSYVVRWNGGEKTVDASQTRVNISELHNGTSYRFTVEARNGFHQDGGVSGPSAASQPVIPYTAPDAPNISGKNSACTDANSCPVEVAMNASGSDGGVGPKTLEYRVNGGEWKKASGTSHTHTATLPSGGSITVEARVKNGVKNEEHLYSSPVKTTQKAKTYTPPAPKVSKSDWAPKGEPGNPGDGSCNSGLCRWFSYTVTGLKPGQTVTVDFTDPTTSDPWGSHQMTADSNGTIHVPLGRFYYGHPGKSVTVRVNKKPVGDIRMPG